MPVINLTPSGWQGNPALGEDEGIPMWQRHPLLNATAREAIPDSFLLATCMG
jgi:hypothetical protein